MLSHDQYNRDLEKMVNDALRKEFGSSEFLVGDLDAQALRNSLTNNKQNVLVLEKLGTTTDKLNQVTEQDFVRAFNEILSMHDFHIRVDANAYKSIISKEMQGVLVRAQTPDAKLSDLEYLRLNKALLQAIYPHETRKTPNGSSEFLVGDLDAQALRNSLTNNKQNVLVLEKLGTTTDKLNQVTEQDFVRAFNEILSMHDFHIRVDANAYKSIISKEMQGVLVRAQTPDAKLSDLEYLRLNKALLQAIYPHETRKTLSKEMQWVLVRAQTPDAKLSDLEYLRLNRALLQAIYPHETRKTLGNILQRSGKSLSDRQFKEVLNDIMYNALRPKEFVYPSKTPHEGGISLGTRIWVTENKLPVQPMSLEDYLLSYKIIPSEIPFFASEA